MTTGNSKGGRAHALRIWRRAGGLDSTFVKPDLQSEQKLSTSTSVNTQHLKNISWKLKHVNQSPPSLGTPWIQCELSPRPPVTLLRARGDTPGSVCFQRPCPAACSEEQAGELKLESTAFILGLSEVVLLWISNGLIG